MGSSHSVTEFGGDGLRGETSFLEIKRSIFDPGVMMKVAICQFVQSRIFQCYGSPQ
jgi:hypothetical protein